MPSIVFESLPPSYTTSVRAHRTPHVALRDVSAAAFLLHRQPQLHGTTNVGYSATMRLHAPRPRGRQVTSVTAPQGPTGSFLLHRSPRFAMTAQYVGRIVMRLHRPPAVRMTTVAGDRFLLHRSPRVALSTSSPAALKLHRQPQTRIETIIEPPAAQAGTFLLHRAPHVVIGEAVPIPTATVFNLHRPPAIRVETQIVYPATMQLHRQPRVLMADGPRMMLVPQRHVRIYDGVETRDRTALLIQQPWMAGSMVEGFSLVVRDALRVMDATAGQETWVWHAQIGMTASRLHLLEGASRMQDSLTVGDLASAVLKLLVAEALALHATPSHFAAATMQVTDALALAAGPGSVLDARDTVASALPLHDASLFVWPAAMREALAMTATQAHGLDGAQQVVDALALQAVPVGRAQFAVLVDDAMALDDAATSAAELWQRIREGVEVLATFHLPGGGQYTAWVLHGDTRAYTQYQNFPFNSFCELSGQYYGCTDTGLYLLEGDDDAGQPIEAHIRGGLSDMGTGRLKRMESMYLGYRADGGLVLKVVTTSDGGDKREDWYALTPQPADAVREGRIKIGKGLKSRYWGFELANVDGADFALDSMAWLPMVLERRI